MLLLLTHVSQLKLATNPEVDNSISYPLQKEDANMLNKLNKKITELRINLPTFYINRKIVLGLRISSE